MKKSILLSLIVLLQCSYSWGHDAHYDKALLRNWVIEKHHQKLEASFFMMKNGEVYLEDANNRILHYPLAALSVNDQNFIHKKQATIDAINASIAQPSIKNTNNLANSRLGILLLLLASLSFLAYRYRNSEKRKFVLPLLLTAVVTSFFNFTQKNTQIQTDPNEMDLAFTPFKPKINTYWDNTYFRVESRGMADHEMMIGITSWQQQVPIPQCYVGANAWSIPLNPVIAASPVPVSPQHFLRGAVAVAVNGVPIFNPYTNTGVDAFVDGQLDNFGGHSGRADDYHYHIAPLHLYSQTQANLPIAYGLDGFGIYGASEPDGTAMIALDANHGHYWTNGVYHYHGTAEAPYMIGNMVGVVTEDSTMQIIPQAAAHPVRPSLTPLNGAVITGCIPNGTNNGYTLSYTKAGVTYYVDYSWTFDGHYTYNFISPTDTVVQNYNGFSQCDIVTNVNENTQSENISIFPNPNNGTFEITNANTANSSIEGVSIYSLDGKRIFNCSGIPSTNAIPRLKPGVYLVTICTMTGISTRKIVVN